MNRLLTLLLVLLLFLSASAQKVSDITNKAFHLLNDSKYEECYQLLKGLDESLFEAAGDSCFMMYNYERGTSSYYLAKYEEAIAYLNKALLLLEKQPEKDCDYLEAIYGIGSCYNHLKQSENAEKYFRRVIIRGNSLGINCSITSQTLSELSEVYNNLGYTSLARDCVSKLDNHVDNIENWQEKADWLINLASSYEEQQMYDEEIATYKKIQELFASNNAKNTEVYLLHSSIFAFRLMATKHIEEAVALLTEMISIGSSLPTHTEHVCFAYENYVKIKSSQNDINAATDILPAAIRYLKNTPSYKWQEHNLYEIIGNELCNNGNDKLGITWLEKTWDKNQVHNMQALGHLGNYYFSTQPEKALAYFLEAEKQIGELSDDETKMVIYESIMYLHSALGNNEETAKYAEKAAPYIRHLKDNDAYAGFLTNWEVVCHNLGLSQKEGEIHSELRTLLPGLSYKTKAVVYSNQGFIYLKEEKYSESIQIITQGIKMVIEQFGETYQLLTTMYHNLGRAYMLQFDYHNALLNLNKSKDLQTKLNGEVFQRTLDYIKECESK